MFVSSDGAQKIRIGKAPGGGTDYIKVGMEAPPFWVNFSAIPRSHWPHFLANQILLTPYIELNRLLLTPLFWEMVILHAESCISTRSSISEDRYWVKF